MDLAVQITSVKGIEISEKLGLSSYCFGDEFCFYKFRTLVCLLDAIKRLSLKKMKIYVTVPIIQQSHLDECIKILSDLLDINDNITFVLNDLGIMYYLAESHSDKHYQVLLGRLLNKNIESCPWNEHIIRNENKYIKDVMYTNSAYSHMTIEHLKQFKVIGVAGNITPFQVRSYHDLRENNNKIASYYDSVYVASSRVCMTLKAVGQKVGNCIELCEKCIEIELDSIKNVSDFTTSLYEDRKVKNMYGSLYVLGNTVFKKYDQEIDFSYSDILFLDARYYDSYEKFEDTIKKIESIILDRKVMALV